MLLDLSIYPRQTFIYCIWQFMTITFHLSRVTYCLIILHKMVVTAAGIRFLCLPCASYLVTFKAVLLLIWPFRCFEAKLWYYKPMKLSSCWRMTEVKSTFPVPFLCNKLSWVSFTAQELASMTDITIMVDDCLAL